MPNFYAKSILDKGYKCFNGIEDTLLSPLFKLTGFCKSIKDYGYKYDSDGNPLIQDCQKNNFALYYTSPESFTLFRAFYWNHDGIQDKYVNYWGKVSSFFANNSYVVGFDPFNEPMASWHGVLDALYVMWPGEMDDAELAPLYTRIQEKYLAANPDSLMWFEPSQFPDTIGVGKGYI